MMEAVREKVELQRYPEYKDSGLNWLGEIPKNWALIRGNYVFDIIDERSKTGKEELLSVSEHHGVKKRSESTVNMFMAESYKGYKLCYPGDLVINSLWAWSRGLGVSNLKGIVSTAYSVFRPDHENYDQKYLHYLLRTRKYVAQYLIASKGIWISRLQLSDWAFLRIPILSPPKEEQTAIANFLERKTEQIDQAIEIKQKQIELLKERRQILIHKAVTRGLNPDAPLKPSGVDWIGDIPEHWEVKQLKFIAHLESGETISSENFTEEGYPVYGGNGFRGYTDKYTNNGEHALIGRQGALCGNVNYAKGKFFASEHAVVVYPLNNENYLWLGEAIKIADFNRLSQSAAQPGISVNVVKNVKFPYPHPSEMEAIASYIDDVSKTITKAIKPFDYQIKKLKEYKTTLINSAVTGKIKVS